MEIIGILLSLFLLIFFAYRGYSVIVFAPIFALLAAVTQGLSVMPAYTELFMGNAVTFVKSFFPIFLLGAIFGKLMEDTGLAKSIASAIVRGVGKEKAILAVVLSCAALTYGGISLFVAVFAVYPLSSALFKEADIPKRLIPGAFVLGAFSFTMDALPGSPQILNLIPTNYFGTTIYAAPICGLVATIGILMVGMWWLERRCKAAQAAGEGYGKNHRNEPIISENFTLTDWKLAVLPLLSVLVVNFLMVKVMTWDPGILAGFQAMKLPLVSAKVANIAGIWGLIVAETVGIALTIVIGYKNIGRELGLQAAVNAGAIGSLLAIMNTASEVGYGNVIAALPGFKSIATALLGIQLGGTPLLSEAVTVNVLAGITGSASGGISIALSLMGAEWLTWANTIGMSPEILHRVAAMAAGGFDTLPHNGGVITLLAVCGLTHKQAYADIFFVTCVKVMMAFVIVVFHMATGLL